MNLHDLQMDKWPIQETSEETDHQRYSSQCSEENRIEDICLKHRRECPENCEKKAEEANEDFTVYTYRKKQTSANSFFGINALWTYKDLPIIGESFSTIQKIVSKWFSSNSSDNEYICKCKECKKAQIKERVAKTSPTSRLMSTLILGLVFLSTQLICAGAASTCNFTSTENGTYTNLNCYFAEDMSKSQQTIYVDFYQRGKLSHPENLITCKCNEGNISCKYQKYYTLVGNVTTYLSVKFSRQPRLGKYVCSLLENDATANEPCDLRATGGGDSVDNISRNESICSIDVSIVVGVGCLIFIFSSMISYLLIKMQQSKGHQQHSRQHQYRFKLLVPSQHCNKNSKRYSLQFIADNDNDNNVTTTTTKSHTQFNIKTFSNNVAVNSNSNFKTSII